MKKTPLWHNNRIKIPLLLSISMVVFSMVIVPTFDELYANTISNSTNTISNSTNLAANMTSDPDNQNGTIASFPGSIDSDRRHMPV
ncbi:hypothetical protein [Candidatus Nitrosocosmicus franklandus]|uniref:Uncharacterized protein n=1 Tax=Candidatus Nitrosocosmicus franklandianus TaxID=1798806 RepID=A0A484I5V0_9ARCH|nr:hypothetical protein [Candidatus Nitrosocosmicus franklandus]VFJ13099.1 conserved protein of unknown function [Candidatus Nitrosocosmicus franklandus]